MSASRYALSLLLLAAALPAEEGDYVIAGGIQWDTDDAFAVSLLADREIVERGWLSLILARNRVDVEQTSSLNTTYAELGFDRHFEPVGLRVAAAYWGDNDILDSIDGRASLYWRNDGRRLALNVEYRDFEFDLPAGRFLPGREFRFDATGIGASAGFDLGTDADLFLSGIAYDYSVNLRLDGNRGLLRLLNVSRLSLINSLVDYRVSAGVGMDRGLSRWQLDLSAWRGAVDQSDTRSLTLSFTTPLAARSDIELGLGYDDSELYGDAVFLSAFVYFYGGS